MKILFLGDTHFKVKANNRTDYAFDTQKRKLKEVFGIAKKEGVFAILQVGDLFDGPVTRNDLVSDLIALLKDSPSPVYTVLGQHDRYMRTGLDRSPTRILAEAGVIEVLTREPKSVGGKECRVDVYGAGFGEPIPQPCEEPSPGRSKQVLVIHEGIHPDPLFPGDKGFSTPRGFLLKHPGYDVIACGDFHGRFLFSSQGRSIFNPGAFFRQTVSDISTPPAVFVWDVEDGEIEKFLLSAEDNPFRRRPSAAAFGGVTYDELIGAFQSTSRKGISFEDKLLAHARKNKVRRQVWSKITEVMEEAAHGEA